MTQCAEVHSIVEQCPCVMVQSEVERSVVVQSVVVQSVVVQSVVVQGEVFQSVQCTVIQR